MISYIKKWTSHNFWAKITVVILAWAVWFMVKSEENVTYQFNTEVNVDVAENMFLVNIEPQKINVTIVGRRNIMDKIEKEEISVNLDLRNKQKTQIIHLPITRDKFNCPPEVSIKNIEPDFVDVQIDRGIKKSLTIKEKYTGKPVPEYTLRAIAVNPSVVEVFGPESVLKDLSVISTKPFSIDRMDTSFTQRVQLEPFYSGSKNLPVVDVYVDISRSLKTKTFSNVALQIIKSPLQKGNITIVPSEVTLTIEGTESYLQTLKESDITVYVHISNLKEGKYELPINTIIPEEYNIVKIEPEVADVTIGFIEIKGTIK